MRNQSTFLITCVLGLVACHNNTPKKPKQSFISKVAATITGDTLQEFMRKADSIVLISHLQPTLSPPNPQTGKLDSRSQLFFDGKLNNHLVTKSEKLSSNEMLILGNILDEHVVDDISYTHCFNPRNAILAYSSNNISYIDVCFECKGLYVVGFPMSPEMSNLKYDKLQKFFDDQGIE